MSHLQTSDPVRALIAEDADKLASRQQALGASTVMTQINTALSVPLALYIHIPWCVKKCPYCDFNSHELTVDHSLSQYEEYVDALLRDARAQQMLVQSRPISSIFIGGGTPSLLPIAQYHRLFAGLRQIFEFSADIEITMEANPGTLEHAPFAEYLDVGINRLSIGVQSFATDKLRALGRIHDSKQAREAISTACRAGFRRVNVDLMHGLADQTVAEALYDIQTAHDAGATHLSWYQLTIEPNTVFYRNQPVLPDDERLAQIEDAGQALLAQLGYRNYEVSAWCGVADSPCRHNLNYWQFGDYLAIGAGAHGKVTLSNNQSSDQTSDPKSSQKDCANPDPIQGWQDSTYNERVKSQVQGQAKDQVKGKGKALKLLQTMTTANTSSDLTEEASAAFTLYRFSKTRLPKDYMRGDNALNMVGWHTIESDEIVSEFMLNALRLHEGVTTSLFEQRTGLSINVIADQMHELIVRGLLEDLPDTIQPTALGRRYLNQILRVFI